jgi:hypothetical protein
VLFVIQLIPEAAFSATLVQPPVGDDSCAAGAGEPIFFMAINGGQESSKIASLSGLHVNRCRSTTPSQMFYSKNIV